MAATFLARLSFHLDRPEFREAAVAAMRAYGKQMSRYPRGFAKSLSLVDFLTEGPVELALIGAKDDPAFLPYATPYGPCICRTAFWPPVIALMEPPHTHCLLERSPSMAALRCTSAAIFPASR